MTFCESCGAVVKPDDRFCENCGAVQEPIPLETKAGSPAQSVPAAASGTSKGEKNPILAAVASFLFSGLGQVYNGSLGKGLLIFFGTLIGSMIFQIIGIVVLLYGIYDAYTTAKKMNENQIPFVPYKTTHIIAFIVIAIVVVIIFALILVGLTEEMGVY